MPTPLHYFKERMEPHVFRMIKNAGAGSGSNSKKSKQFTSTPFITLSKPRPFSLQLSKEALPVAGNISDSYVCTMHSKGKKKLAFFFLEYAGAAHLCIIGKRNGPYKDPSS